jgi:hypothetical protein
MLSWTLLIAGASVAALVSTSFDRPKTTGWRCFYFLFALGWVGLALSLYFGFHISQGYIAAVITKKTETLSTIEGNLNGDFSGQLLSLQCGFGCLAAWLVWFLIWFVFVAPQSTGSVADADKAAAQRVIAEAAAQTAKESSQSAESAATRAETARTETQRIADAVAAQHKTNS